MKIYTKGGDQGETGLPGARLGKSDAVIEALGDLDELNSVIGWASVARPPCHAMLKVIQSTLLDFGACVADPRRPTPASLSELTRQLEAHIDEMDAQLPPLTRFILPGGCEAGARLHVARSVCRRAERSLVKSGCAREGWPFLNRLSDWLFTAARFANHPDHPEAIYQSS